MRTSKWDAFLSGLCAMAVGLGTLAAAARADVTVERGASILAFPKVLAHNGSDTLIQITNVSNSMVHVRCFYVNAQLRFPDLPESDNPLNPNLPLWQETDFNIWLTKQQPTHWRVSNGRFVDPLDDCFRGNRIQIEACENAGIDPGAIPPVPENFIGELKCVEVDAADVPIGGNHLKGEATIKTGGDVAKYNAIGFEATEFAGETGNTLLLNWPKGTEPEEGQQYSACPRRLILNHYAEGVTDPVVLANGRGGFCSSDHNSGGGFSSGFTPCQSDADCGEGRVCEDGPQISVASGRLQALRSATLTDLTLVPCSQDLENQRPVTAKLQFVIYNEFETRFSASTSVTCWKNFFLHQVTSPNNPANSQFSVGPLGSTVAQTVIEPVSPAAGGVAGGVIGVAGVLRADRDGQIARTLLNLHIEGDLFSATGREDRVILPEP